MVSGDDATGPHNAAVAGQGRRSVMVCGGVVAFLYGLSGRATIAALLPLTLAALPFPLLALGLGVLSNTTARRGPVDVLDATTTALAGFLLLWITLIEPVFTLSAPATAVAVALPISGLIAFAIAVKIILGGGLREPAIRLLMLFVALLLATMVGVLAPGLTVGVLRPSPLPDISWKLSGVVLGAIGLLRSLTTLRRPGDDATFDLSPRRLLLFAALTVVPLFVWGYDVTRSDRGSMPEGTALLVPLITSAALLLMLVLRLGLVARLAQRRAGALERRSAALARSVAEQKDLQRELAYRALHDPLTGLANRLVLTEEMDRALARHTVPTALLLLDLDGFKDVNDTFGHPVGDELLVQAAQRLMTVTPERATLARLGGDEFAIFLENVDIEAARERADLVVTALRHGYTVSGRDLFLTTSAGVLTIDPDRPPPTSSEALRDADLALYAAKATGKNRAVVFTPDLRTSQLDHSRVSTGLRRALVYDEFYLNYQPVFRLESHTIEAVEALVRWQPTTGGMVAPSEFLPVAEETGLIVPIGAWVLRRACRDARAWWQEHRVSLSVNVSVRQLDDDGFADSVLTTLAEAGLPAEALILELAEHHLITAARTAGHRRQLERLQSHGVRIAINNFGSGYSSLAYLARIPISMVKVDRSFTRGYDEPATEPHDWAATKAILQLVDTLHLQAVAEGVETAEQADALAALRCPLVQGYHFSRPVPAGGIDRQLAGLPLGSGAI